MQYTGLAKRLVDTGLLSSADLQTAITAATNQQCKLLDYVLEKHLVDNAVFALQTAKTFGYPLVDLNAIEKSYLPLTSLKKEMIEHHKILPLRETHDHLYIAMVDPTEKSILDEIYFSTKKAVIPIIVSRQQLLKYLELLQHAAIDEINLNDVEIIQDEILNAKEINFDTNDAPIIRFVQKILLDALQKNASDIHIEPYEKLCRIRFRIDGVLIEIKNPPINLAARICARIKVISRMDISERRIPQDGRFKLNCSPGRSIDFRVSSCPTIYGEKMVIRILDPSVAAFGIEALGFDATQKEIFLHHIYKPQGLILVTGPTGSGKTVTMYSGIHLLNTNENNICTVEDPVEIYVNGINQVNINLKAGLTFATALRSFLRQDPDIIMVGEMRDLETAEIAVKAAQTGHLVLSTLHTNSATETLTRLANMGLPLYNIATSVVMIIAQRLIRKLCEQCKIMDALAVETLHASAAIFKANPIGCSHCHAGYKGRTGIYELLPSTTKLSAAILANANALELFELAKTDGFLPLREAGISKVIAGITSMDEINRVI